MVFLDHWSNHLLLYLPPLLLGEQSCCITGTQCNIADNFLLKGGRLRQLFFKHLECYFFSKAVFFAPLFLVSLGGVLFFNGLQLYLFYLMNIDEGSAVGSASGSLGSSNSSDINLLCIDVRASGQNDIFDEEKYILMEFVGALTSVLFFVSS